MTTFVMKAESTSRRGVLTPLPGSFARKPTRTLLLSFSTFAIALLLMSGSASAAELSIFSRSIGSPGSGNGQLSLAEHSGVAVNQATGDVYVADTGNGRVEQFEADGTFVRTFGSLTAPTYIAIDNSGGASSGAVYVVDSANGTLSKFESDGTAVSAWGTGGQISGFGEVKGIAVSPAGDLFVLSEVKTLHRFSPAGSEVGTPVEATERETSPAGLGIDTEGNLYKAGGGQEVVKFTSAGSQIGGELAQGALALATDPSTGDLLVVRAFNGETVEPVVARFALNCGNNCEPTEVAGGGDISNPQGVAIGPDGTLYVTDATTSTILASEREIVQPPTATIDPPTEVEGFSAHVTGDVNPEGLQTSCGFQVVSEASYLAEGFSNAQDSPCETNPGSGSVPISVEARLEGLQPGTNYHVRLSARSLAGSANSPEPNPTFTTLAISPAISGQEARDVGQTTASLFAAIAPGGAPTTYRFEYLPEAAFLAEGFSSSTTRTTVELGPTPADNVAHLVSAPVAGLNAAVRYVFRAAATNPVETVFGSASSFVTQASSFARASGCANELLRVETGPDLPECRAYELISPVEKNGIGVEGLASLASASPSGSAVTYYTQTGTSIPATGGGAQTFPTYLATLGGDGWSSQRLLPPQRLGEKAEYLGATPDLRYALVEAGDSGEGLALYVIDTTNGELRQITPAASAGGSQVYAFDGASADGSRLFFETTATIPVTSGPAPAPGVDNLYMWMRSTGAVTLVGVLPGAPEAPSAGSFGGAYSWYESQSTSTGGALAANAVGSLNAISPSGDQVYFTAGETGQLYLRYGLTGIAPATAHVSEPEPGATDPFAPLPATFQEATPSGSDVFFLSQEKLTADATTGEFDEGTDLYRWDEKSGTLTDIAPYPSEENGARVRGLLGVSADGTSGYFVARGNLAAGAEAGQENIFRFDEANGEIAISYVATLGSMTGPFGADRRNVSPMGNLTFSLARNSRVTPDAATLLFTSTSPITGYESSSKTGGIDCGGGSCAEIFRYSAKTASVTCISCNPTGERPRGAASLQSTFIGAFFTPSADPATTFSRNLSADGTRVFFQTPDPLLAGDTNGQSGCRAYNEGNHAGPAYCQDVYEWRAAGTESCNEVQINGGCLSLLSTGQSSRASYFVDASKDAATAFITTTSQLVPVDKDQLYDLYSVATGGGSASQHVVPPAPCLTEGTCRSARSSPEAAGPDPGTTSLVGPTNLHPGKHKTKKHKQHHGKQCKKKTRKHCAHHGKGKKDKNGNKRSAAKTNVGGSR